MPQEPKPPLPELTSELGATIYAFENRGQFRAVQVFTDGTNFLAVTPGLSKAVLRKAAKKAVKFATIEEALAKLAPVRSQPPSTPRPQVHPSPRFRSRLFPVCPHICRSPPLHGTAPAVCLDC